MWTSFSTEHNGFDDVGLRFFSSALFFPEKIIERFHLQYVLQSETNHSSSNKNTGFPYFLLRIDDLRAYSFMIQSEIFFCSILTEMCPHKK